MRKYTLATLCCCLMMAGMNLPGSARCPALKDPTTLENFKKALNDATIHGKLAMVDFGGEWEVEARDIRLINANPGLIITDVNPSSFGHEGMVFVICQYKTNSERMPKFGISQRIS